MMNIAKKVLQAKERIENYLQPTPLIFAYQLSKRLDAHVYLKLENLQPTGSFKIRGAFNKLLSLAPEEQKRGVIAASTGNHGAAVAFACKELAIPCTVYVPESASTAKIANIKSYDADMKFHGAEVGEAEQYARNVAHQNQRVYISPYNDEDVIAGQGTIGYELSQQLPAMDMVLAAVGGGGLMGGIAAYMKSLDPATQTIGCLPENSPTMYECIKAGKTMNIETKPTLSDATAGNNDLDTITFPICQKYVDDYVLVSEEEIKTAMRFMMEKEHLLVEGSVGATVSSLLKINHQVKHKNVVVIVSGANISTDTLKKIIC